MYHVVTAHRLRQLEDMVNEDIKRGFIPIGGLTSHGDILIQAMHLQEQPKKAPAKKRPARKQPAKEETKPAKAGTKKKATKK